MQIKIIANEKGNPPGKLADAELYFGSDQFGAKDGEPLEGLKLVGFAIWERRTGSGGRNVTFPARQYSVNGERRSFALLRPIVDTTAQDRIRELILQAYAEYEHRENNPVTNPSSIVDAYAQGLKAGDKAVRDGREAEAKHANDLKF